MMVGRSVNALDVCVATAVTVIVAMGIPAAAQDRVGGHFGVALPLVTHAQAKRQRFPTIS